MFGRPITAARKKKFLQQKLPYFISFKFRKDMKDKSIFE